MSNLFNLKTFLQFLEKNKLYTFINIFGLAISLMFVILIAVYTTQELSTDSFQKKANRIYLLANTGGEDKDLESFYGTAYRLAERISERYPEVEKICPMAPMNDKTVSVENIFYKADLLLADTSFFEIFTFPLTAGEPSQVFNGKYNAVISESFAKKAFHGTDPVGQRIDLGDSMIVTVSGITKGLKNSVIHEADIILRIDNVGRFNSSMDSHEYNNAGSALIFILAHEGADLQGKAEDLSAYLKEIFWFYKRGIFTRTAFVPLKDVYFSKTESANLIEQGNRTFVLILLSIGVIILLFAVINYINLTTAQAGFRAKEMATRRLLGAARSELFIKLILEAALLSLISFIIGLVLAFYFETYAGNLLEKPLNIVGFISPVSILGFVALIAVLGIMAGVLPAIIMSNAKPLDVMKGSLRTKTKMVFSKIFITFQNAITIAMIVASITMIMQTNHLINAPLGYNTGNIISLDMNQETNNRQKSSTFVSELKSSPYVKQISFCQGTPFSRGNNNTIVYEDRNISTQTLIGDSAYFRILGIETVRENGLEPGKGAYINQYALKELNLSENVTEIKFNDSWTVPIAGIVKDFQLRDITCSMQTVMLYVRNFDFEERHPWNMLIEVEGDPKQAYDNVGKIYERIIQAEFNGKFIDSQVAENFASMVRTSRIVSIFGGIAIIISLLGLLAISTYFVQQRSREIAVRKVFGSNNPEILRKLIGYFTTYVLIAFIIATPIIWYIMKQWLSDYSYRISLSPLIFLAAGLFCLVISFLTVFIQSYQAANANPVKSLKSE